MNTWRRFGIALLWGLGFIAVGTAVRWFGLSVESFILGYLGAGAYLDVTRRTP